MHPVLIQIGSLVIPSYGACAALGVLLALVVATATARKTGLASTPLEPSHSAPGTRHGWNLVVLAVFAALAASRLLLVAFNWSELRRHPAWLLAISAVHHPLLSAAGLAGATVAVCLYARWARLPLRAVGDCLAAPSALGIAAEQAGALLAGSDFGRELDPLSLAQGAWSVTYASPFAARWSGTPLGIPLFPVQAYAALGALLLASLCFTALFFVRRQGDVAGLWLLGAGVLLFLTEQLRDWLGRGPLLGGLLNIPQLVALGMVLGGGLVLWDWQPASLPGRQSHV